jgi:hypothetical protein
MSHDPLETGIYDNVPDRATELFVTVGDHDTDFGFEALGQYMRQFCVKRCSTAGTAQGDTLSGQLFAIQSKPGRTGWTFNNHQKTSQKNDRASE